MASEGSPENTPSNEANHSVTPKRASGKGSRWSATKALARNGGLDVSASVISSSPGLSHGSPPSMGNPALASSRSSPRTRRKRERATAESKSEEKEGPGQESKLMEVSVEANKPVLKLVITNKPILNPMTENASAMVKKEPTLVRLRMSGSGEEVDREPSQGTQHDKLGSPQLPPVTTDLTGQTADNDSDKNIKRRRKRRSKLVEDSQAEAAATESKIRRKRARLAKAEEPKASEEPQEASTPNDIPQKAPAKRGRKPKKLKAKFETTQESKLEEPKDVRAEEAAPLSIPEGPKLSPRKSSSTEEGALEENAERANDVLDPTDQTNEVVDRDNCTACGMGGEFISCEGCSRVFHLVCLFPPLKVPPLDSWHCIDCSCSRPELLSRNPSLQKAKENLNLPLDSYQAVWDVLVAEVAIHNPTAFKLPKKLRLRNDEIIDRIVVPRKSTLEKRSRSNQSVCGERIKGEGRIRAQREKAPPSRTTDYGHCHRCGQRAINPKELPLRIDAPLQPRPLLRCDECPLLWHLDCIDPPPSTIPSVETRWLCPAHIDIPIHPNYIPNVALENEDARAYAYPRSFEIPFAPPPGKIILPETTILLDFAAAVRRLNGPVILEGLPKFEDPSVVKAPSHSSRNTSASTDDYLS